MHLTPLAAPMTRPLPRPLDSWAAQLQEIATFVAIVDGEDVGLVRGAPMTYNLTPLG